MIGIWRIWKHLHQFDLGDEEDEKMLEDLEDKQLLARIQSLEAENSLMTEKVRKLEHHKTWVENRLVGLEAEVTALKGAPLELATYEKE